MLASWLTNYFKLVYYINVLFGFLAAWWMAHNTELNKLFYWMFFFLFESCHGWGDLSCIFKSFLCQGLQNHLSKSLNSTQSLPSSGISVQISALSWLALSSSYHLIYKVNRSILTILVIWNKVKMNSQQLQLQFVVVFFLFMERVVTHPAHPPSSASLLLVDARGAQCAHKIPKTLQN